MATLLIVFLAVGLALAPDARGLAPTEDSNDRRSNTRFTAEAVAMSMPYILADDVRELPMRLRSLLRDEYTFFRGSAGEFYGWCVQHCGDWLADRSKWIPIHGDVHIGNVGTFQTSFGPRPSIRFGLVDFDEAVIGPFQLDLLRALASVKFSVAAAGRRLDPSATHRAADAMVNAYRQYLSAQLGYDDLIRTEPTVAAILKKSAENHPERILARYVDTSRKPRFRPARMKGSAVMDILEPAEKAMQEEMAVALLEFVRHNCSPETRKQFRIRTREDADEAIMDVVRRTRVGSSGSQGVHKYFVLLEMAIVGGPPLVILEFKEQPPPAAVRAGLVENSPGSSRAAELAGHVTGASDPPPLLVGHAQMQGRRFLVYLRDPYGEDLDPSDYKLKRSPPGEAGLKRAMPAGAIEMARVLGAALGIAHRHSMGRDESRPAAGVDHEQSARIVAILEESETLASVLADRSAAVEDYMRSLYVQLCADPRARLLARQADEFVNSAALGKPVSHGRPRPPTDPRPEGLD